MNHYRDEATDDANENNPAGNCIKNNYKTTISKLFEYKTKIKGNAAENNSRLDPKVVVLLKYWSNFWRSFNLLLINFEIRIDFSWSRKCIMSEIPRTTEGSRR